jgi:hypothetical protein
MKRIVLVSKEMSTNNDKMEKVVLEAARRGHSGGALCVSGFSLEFQLEEDAIDYGDQQDIEVLKVDPTSLSLIPVKR